MYKYYFYGIIVGLDLIGFALVRDGYKGRAINAGLMAWIFAGAFVLVALLWERRLITPGQAFKGAFYGDVFLLPAIAICLSIMAKDAPADGLQTKPGWLIFSAVLSLAIGFVFHRNDAGAYARAGVPGAMNTPTKLLHDGGIMPVFIYYLFSQVPVIFTNHSPNRALVTTVALVCFVIFIYLAAVYDAKHFQHQAHPASYDWRTLKATPYSLER